VKDLLQRNKQHIPQSVWRVLIYIYRRWFNPGYQRSYAQNGEDMILAWHLSERKSGFYVDIGAHHPIRYSNTYRLYRRGWNGINVDATPGSMREFRRLRPRDTNIEAAVADVKRDLTFYVFQDPTVNTLDKGMALQHIKDGRVLAGEVLITTKSLAELLDQYLPDNGKIDLLTIDVEGFDLEVLTSNDWTRFTPDFVLIECLDALTFAEVSSSAVTEFLSKQYYSPVAKTVHTVLYKRMA
jgi:FkbM family methyltransferase